MTRPLRSALFLPASNARAIEKARGLACDAVVLDLEDATAPEAKAEARELMLETLAKDGFGARTVVVRVNGLDTEWGDADLEAAAHAGPDAILAPKVTDAESLLTYDRLIAGAPERTRLWAMVVTCAAGLNLISLAALPPSPRLAALVPGVLDLSLFSRSLPGFQRISLD